MRAFFTTIVTTLLLSTFVFANPNSINPETINKNCEKGLVHKNQGVVESTIKVVVLIKIKYPNADYSDVIDELNDLIMEGSNKNIRLKALIATDYLTNFEQYSWLKNGDYSEGDKLFDAYLMNLGLTKTTK